MFHFRNAKIIQSVTTVSGALLDFTVMRRKGTLRIARNALVHFLVLQTGKLKLLVLFTNPGLYHGAFVLYRSI